MNTQPDLDLGFGSWPGAQLSFLTNVSEAQAPKRTMLLRAWWVLFAQSWVVKCVNHQAKSEDAE